MLLLTAMLAAAPALKKVGNMQELREKAMAGSASAAMEVVDELYREVASPQRPHPAEAWLMIAAENGSASGQHAYAQLLIRNSPSDREAELRAMYWLRKSAAKKFAPAIKMLSRMNE